ncbi:MAG: glycosyl transferase, partial [Acidobacteriota bacterium]|nr:glycosyl transferase [Acidobacteriota bacterium]
MTASRASRPTVMYYCQHSVGLGHFVRSLAIAEALSERFRVVMVSGGANPQESLVPSGVELVDLPAIAAADGRGSRLVSVDPRRELEDVWRAREHTLLQLLGRLRPSALVVELFPFGRRKFERELVPLLEDASAMDPAPAIIS